MSQLLVESTLKATTEGRLQWEPDPTRPSRDPRSSVVTAVSVVAGERVSRRLVASLEGDEEQLWLELEREQYEPGLGARALAPYVAFSLLVRDAEGAVVRRVLDHELDPPDQARLSELWDAALESAKGPREVDQRVSELLSRLRAKAS